MARWKNSRSASLRAARSARFATGGAFGPRTRSTDAGDMPGGAVGGGGAAARDAAAGPSEAGPGATPATLATARAACSAGDGAGAATGACPDVFGWYIRYSSACAMNAARSRATVMNSMSLTGTRTCRSGTARACIASLQMMSAACFGRAPTPFRSGRIWAARSSGVARACACST